ncbi:inactive hydroxysteroid dehydrogenase-like protein 1 [Musca domestica]|uniref:Inactive hydroxysteroid dehydrogenase-like protein 1 n=1 Tax=Musca domestica TaxID=7370 RepID=A0A1I8NG60_MUSDO|nr:inactive hydroxysteroid dehydrogenase-like protein 1 [Musca domestica]
MIMLEFFAIIGIYVCVCILCYCLKTPVLLLYHKYLTKNIPLTERFGKWAAITGSTDGIGKAYAKQLAHRGFNLVLIARNKDKLEYVAKEIETCFNVEVMTIQADFSLGPEIYAKLFEAFAKKPIGLLVNNVGTYAGRTDLMWSFPRKLMWDMIYVNMAAATELSLHFVRVWEANGTRGCIVNVSSGLESYPAPYGGIYSATKAYMRNFTTTLRYEVRHLGITVQLLSPHFVSTKLVDFSSYLQRGNFLVPTADVYARHAIQTLGKDDTTTGYFWHTLNDVLLKMVPYYYRAKVFDLIAKCLVDDYSEMITKLNDEKRVNVGNYK